MEGLDSQSFLGLQKEAKRLEQQLLRDNRSSRHPWTLSNVEYLNQIDASHNSMNLSRAMKKSKKQQSINDKDNLNTRSMNQGKKVLRLAPIESHSHDRPGTAPSKSPSSKHQHNSSNQSRKNTLLSSSVDFSHLHSIVTSSLESSSCAVETTASMPMDDPLYRILEDETNIIINNDRTSSYDHVTCNDLKILAQFESPPPELFITARISYMLIMLIIRSFIDIRMNKVTIRVGDDVARSFAVVIDDISSSQVFRNILQRYDIISSDIIKLRDISARAISEQFSWMLYRELLACDHMEALMHIIYDPVYDSVNLTPYEATMMQSFTEHDIQLLRELCRPRTFHPASCMYFSPSAAKFTSWTRKAVALLYNSYLIHGSSIALASHHTNDRHDDDNDGGGMMVASWFESNNITSTTRLKDAFSYKYTTHTSDANALSFLLCLSSSTSSWDTIISSMLQVAPCFGNIDVIISSHIKTHDGVEDDAHESTIREIHHHIQRSSCTPTHRVIDFRNYHTPLSSSCNIAQYLQSQAQDDILALPLSSMQRLYHHQSIDQHRIICDDITYDDQYTKASSLPFHRLALLSDHHIDRHQSFNKFAVFVTDTSDSKAGFKFATCMLKPLDLITLIHIPMPSVEDFLFVASLYRSNSSTSSYSDILASLTARLQGRTRRVQAEYKQLGYNLFVADDMTSMEMLQCYDMVTRYTGTCNRQQVATAAYRRSKAKRVAEACAMMEADYMVIGASMDDLSQVMDVALNHALSDIENSTKLESTSVLSQLIEQATTSIIVIADI